MSSQHDAQHSDGPISIAGGPIAALVTAGLLGRYRDGVGATNVALVLAAIVMLAALAGRTAGIVTALTAAVSFNYFHTAPYHSLRISGGRDVVTVALLAALGLFVSEIGAWRRRNSATAHRAARTAHVLESAAELVAAGAPPDALLAMTRATLIDTLGLADCRFEPGERVTSDGVILLPRSGALVGPSMRLGVGGFELPIAGAAIAVAAGSTTFGHLVLVPDDRHGSTLDDRRAAIALADLLALALRLATESLSGR